MKLLGVGKIKNSIITLILYRYRFNEITYIFIQDK